MKKALSIAIGIAILLFCLGTIELSGLVFKRSTLFVSCQPSGVDYAGRDPYCLRIIKNQQIFTHKYLIQVAPQNQPDYGHVLSYPDPFVIDEREITATKVVWNDSAIEVTTYLDTQLIIPKKNFTQGR